MALNTTNTLCKDTYESLLMGYAFGVLDQAQSLIVAGHLTLSPHAREFAKSCERMAGALLEKDCPPVSMSNNALDCVMKALDTAPCHDEKHCTHHKKAGLPDDLELPEPLLEPLNNCPNPFEWKTLYSGFKTYDLPLPCQSSKARLVKLAPGLKTPHHEHRGIEITLVLSGAYLDETGAYRRGDLIVTDETIDHSPKACPEAGCVCMIVSSAPVKFTGLASVLNPFLKT